MKPRDEYLVYTCATDWDTEIPWATDELPELFKSRAALKRARACWKECGIVELKLSFKRLVKRGTQW